MLRVKSTQPLLKELDEWLDGQSFLPKSLIGKALTYTPKHVGMRDSQVGAFDVLSGILETTLDPLGLSLRKQFLCRYRFVCHRQTNVQQSLGMGAFEWNSARRKLAFDLEFHLQTTKDHWIC